MNANQFDQLDAAAISEVFASVLDRMEATIPSETLLDSPEGEKNFETKRALVSHLISKLTEDEWEDARMTLERELIE